MSYIANLEDCYFAEDGKLMNSNDGTCVGILTSVAVDIPERSHRIIRDPRTGSILYIGADPYHEAELTLKIQMQKPITNLPEVVRNIYAQQKIPDKQEEEVFLNLNLDE